MLSHPEKISEAVDSFCFSSNDWLSVPASLAEKHQDMGLGVCRILFIYFFCERKIGFEHRFTMPVEETSTVNHNCLLETI